MHGSARFDFGITTLTIRTLRAWLSGLVAITGIITLYSLSMIALTRRQGETAELDVRYAGQFYPLLSVPEDLLQRAVRLGSFEAIIAAARSADVDIFHYRNGIGDYYAVFDGPTMFIYRVLGPRAAVNPSATDPVVTATPETPPTTRVVEP